MCEELSSVYLTLRARGRAKPGEGMLLLTRGAHAGVGGALSVSPSQQCSRKKKSNQDKCSASIMKEKQGVDDQAYLTYH